MSTIPRPGFFRPYVVDYTGDFVTLDGTAINITEGTYANALSVAMSIMSKAWNDAVAEVDVKLTDNIKIAFYSNSGTITIEWDNTAVRDLLGFTGASTSLTASTWIEATYTPTHCWIPGKQRADQGMFYQQSKDWSDGTYTDSGIYVGAPSRSNSIYYRNITFQRELTENLIHAAYDSDAYQKARCLETFIRGAVTANPSVATYARATGFWYYDDLNDAITDCDLNTTDPWSEGTDLGVEFDHTDTPDTKVFCSIGPESLGSVVQSPGMPAGVLRFNTNFSFNTCTPPTWTYEAWDGEGE